MHEYSVTVATGEQRFSGTDAYVFLTLVGDRSSSEKTKLDKFFHDDFARGAVDSYDIKVPEDLGKIVFVKLEMRKCTIRDDWYCRYIKVRTPSGGSLEFPCYRWVTDDTDMVLRDGRARLPQDDKSAMEREHRQEELGNRRKLYRWTEWQPGFPMSIDTESYKRLPLDVKFDFQKEFDFDISYIKAIGNLKLNDFVDLFQTAWDSIDYFKKIYIGLCEGPEYVMQHWQEDFMFGYQFLNGCNPVMIRMCTKLPAKFPVTHEMVEFCLERGLTLEEEVMAGNIYIADYELLENILPNATDPSTHQYLAAPICLLYRNTKNKILPIAIQLDQNPGDESPIFFPNDAEFDWMLAKIWVRYSDFSVHQTITHLMCTHLISEAFAVAMFRQLAAVHPVYKLLIPHIRFTIAINTKARDELIGKNGFFDKANGTGGGGHVELLQKAMKTFTYRSLIFPEAIKARGMDKQDELPTYFYRDDGYKVWEAIRSFVGDVAHIYYRSDEMVQEDKEIQAFAEDVCVFGMHDSCGFPKSLRNREELTEYLTAIIFNASAQHAAVNYNQFNWYSWIPNCPSTMRQPPPTKKGMATMEYIAASLPDRGRSCWHMGAAWALSQFQDNELFLGMYPDEHFIEKPVKKAMEKYRKKLAEVSRFIKARNEGMEMPYYYLSPDRIPNSVAV